MLRTDFTDAEHWSELAQKHLTRYDLSVLCLTCSITWQGMKMN